MMSLLHLIKPTLNFATIFQESDFVAFMKNPQSAPPPPPPATPHSEWGHLDGAEHLLHLTESNFTSIDDKDNVLVMFYAPCEYGRVSDKILYKQKTMYI